MTEDYRGTEAFRPRRAAPRRRGVGNDDDPDDARRLRPTLGIVSVAIALVTMGIVAVGMSASLRGDFATGTALAFVSTGVSIVAVLGGLSALLLGRGRGWGLLAVVLGLIANPLLLTKILGLVSALG